MLSYYIVLRMSSDGVEPGECERGGIESGGRRARGDHVGQYTAGCRAVLKSMAAEPADNVEAWDGFNRAYYGHRIGSDFIEPGPCMRDRSLCKCGEPPGCNRCDSFEEFPIHGEVITRPLVRVGHTVQDAGAFAVEINLLLKLDHHYIVSLAPA